MNKKTIWITGGSTGIGKALAIKFASKGWNVAISARRENLLKEISNEGWNVAISARRENLIKEISDNNANIYGFPLDVTDKSKCKEVFEQIKNKFHNIDICFFSSRRRHTRYWRDWSSDVCSSDLPPVIQIVFLFIL